MPFNIRSSGSYYAIFDDSNLSSNRTYTLPNQSGALLTTNATASQAVTSSFAVTASFALSSAGGGGGALGAPTYVVTKPSNETVTSSRVLQDDDALYQALLANKTYRFQFNLLLDRTNVLGTPGFDFAVAGNSQGTWNFFHNSPQSNFIKLANGTSNSDSFPGGGITAGTPVLEQIRGVVKLTSDFTLQLKWCQGASSATGAIVSAKSQLIIWEL